MLSLLRPAARLSTASLLRPRSTPRPFTMMTQSHSMHTTPPAQKPPIKDPSDVHHRPISIQQLLENNKEWATQLAKERPGFFESLAKQQNPEILWIGCSDSRVPANQLLKLLPGEVFVHRNIANIVHAADLNSHSVLQFAVDVLKVKHVIVCGHYSCGGVAAALTNKQFGLVDHWIRSIKDLYSQHESALSELSPEEKLDRMVELNVARSVDSVAHSTVVQNAWARGQELEIHGWVYRLTDGLLNDLGIKIASLNDLSGVHKVGKK